MEQWECAELAPAGDDDGTLRVAFSHQDSRENIGGDEFWSTMAQLGDEGWELVSSAVLAADDYYYTFKRSRGVTLSSS